VPKGGERSAVFPAIEKKQGKPAAHWLKLLTDLGDAKYAEQMALLQERHGFSRAHANALVMYARGSTSSQRFDGPAAYFASIPPKHRALSKKMFTAVQAKHPILTFEVAWNQPMLRKGKDIVFAVGSSSNHLLINLGSKTVLDTFADRLADFEVNKHTIRIPLDWTVNAALLNALVTARLKELSPSSTVISRKTGTKRKTRS
jgi:uncharacterized protein YdhG (YjbR/CyaY superfamily)